MEATFRLKLAKSRSECWSYRPVGTEWGGMLAGVFHSGAVYVTDPTADAPLVCIGTIQRDYGPKTESGCCPKWHQPRAQSLRRWQRLDKSV